MSHLRLLALGAVLVACLGVGSAIPADIRGSAPGIQAPVMEPPDWQAGTSRLGTGIVPGEIREFTMTQPASPAECRLACERSGLCRSWTMKRDTLISPRAPRVDYCYLLALAPAARANPCCTSGLRRSPLPPVAETLTGDGEMVVANSSYASTSSYATAYLGARATYWSCRAACIEAPACAYWTFHPADAATRYARCFYTSSPRRMVRADGWTAGGPVPR